MTAERPDSPSLQILRARAHALRAVVRVGQRGLSEALLRELDQALIRHELVKVRLAGEDRAARAAQLERLADASGAQVVQRIGHTATLYRRRPDEDGRRSRDGGTARPASRRRAARAPRRRSGRAARR